MPFFVVDDGAHSHPKLVRATNAAVGLWVRIGSYVAQHLTDGHVPGQVATMYGTGPQIKKLLAVGLWHENGHTCPRCPQPRPGDYYMHDYRESGNPSRAEVQQKRARAAEKKRQQRAAGARPQPGPTPNPPLFDDDSQPDPSGIGDDSPSFPPPDSDEAAGQSDPSPGDSLGTSRGREPLHSTPFPKRGVTEREHGAGSSGRAHEPPLSLIPADWQPSEDDVAAAQLARTAAGREQLTQPQLAAVTRKFVRRQLDDGTRAAAWGGRWQQWAERERIEPGGAGGVVVPFAPGGSSQQSKGQQQREGLALLMQTGEV